MIWCIVIKHDAQRKKNAIAIGWDKKSKTPNIGLQVTIIRHLKRY